jgi:hypothetical protein
MDRVPANRHRRLTSSNVVAYGGLASQTLYGWQVPPYMAVFNNLQLPLITPPGVIVPYAPAYNVFGAYQGTP